MAGGLSAQAHGVRTLEYGLQRTTADAGVGEAMRRGDLDRAHRSSQEAMEVQRRVVGDAMRSPADEGGNGQGHVL